MDAVSGYMGGHVPDPTYKQVCFTDSGHAEAVEVTYDPSKVTYEDLLEWFFKFHDPTQVNRQGPDVGPQYRSAIFPANEEQREKARAFIAEVDASGRFKRDDRDERRAHRDLLQGRGIPPGLPQEARRLVRAARVRVTPASLTRPA